MDKIYFQHLDIGINWILKDHDYFKKLYQDVANKSRAHWKLTISDLTNEILDWLDNHDLAVKYVELFYCASKSNIFLHSDEIEPKDCCKINWVYDQGDTWMRWAELKEGKQLSLQNNTIGGTYYAAQPGDYDYVEQTKIGQPTLINAYHLHDVVNPTDYDRWCISVVPKYKHNQGSRLTINEALAIFRPYFRNDNIPNYRYQFFS